MPINVKYWAVGASFRNDEDVYEDMSDGFLENKEWYDGHADGGNPIDDGYLENVNVGDILLMKSASTKGKGHGITFTKLKAIGRVLSKFDYYHFEMQWFEADDLPLDFDYLAYRRTIEPMRDDEMLYYARQVLLNNDFIKAGIELPGTKRPKPIIVKNSLEWKPKPKDGYSEIPESKGQFKGVDIDFLKKSKEQKNLGNHGEELVKQREIEFLKLYGRYDEASKVEIVKDGKGYDIFSYDKDGNEKFIEVKTTNANEYYPFNLSENEIAFMRKHPNQYCIYRIYNYDEESNAGQYYEITGDVESQLIMKPINFKVFIKKEN